MSITTYAELKTAVATWAHDSNLTSIIPDFITAVENDIAYGLELPNLKVDPLRVLDMNTRATASITSQYEEWPSDALAITNIQLNTTDKVSLKYLTPEQIDDKKMGSTTGAPLAYTTIGRQFQFAPEPDGTYTCEIAYIKKYAAFSADADVNWILTNHPFVYLYGALGHAENYLRNNDQADIWFGKYASLVNGLNGSEKTARYSGSTIRMQT